MNQQILPTDGFGTFNEDEGNKPQKVALNSASSTNCNCDGCFICLNDIFCCQMCCNNCDFCCRDCDQCCKNDCKCGCKTDDIIPALIILLLFGIFILVGYAIYLLIKYCKEKKNKKKEIRDQGGYKNIEDIISKEEIPQNNDIENAKNEFIRGNDLENAQN